MKKGLAWCLLFFFLLQSKGEAARVFEHYNSRDGLLSNQTFGVLQDGQGRLWVACLEGVCTFNGLTFDCFNLTEKLTGDKIIGLTLDPQQRVWAYTFGGAVFKFNGKQFVPYGDNDKLQILVGNSIVNNMVFDNQGNFFFSTVLGSDLVKVVPKERKISVVSTADKPYRYFIQELSPNTFITGNSKGTKNQQVGVQCVDTTFTFSLSGGAGIAKSNLLKLRSGDFLYGKDYELVKFNKQGVQSRVFLEKGIECILEDSEGHIWVGLNTGGLIHFRQKDLQNTSSVKYLSTRTVTDLYEDNSGLIWITTSNSGLYTFSQAPGIEYSSPQVFSSSGDSDKVEVNRPVEIAYEPDQVARKEAQLGAGSVPPTIIISGVRIKDQDTTVLSSYELANDKNFIKVNFAGLSPNQSDMLQYRYRLFGVDDDWVYTSNTEAQYTTLPPGDYQFIVNAMNKEGIWGEQPAAISFTIHNPFWKTWWFVSGISVLALGLLSGGVYYWQFQLRQKERAKNQIEKRIANLELQALRAQMNPHFLFNTVSSIQYFITANDSRSALKYLSKFAKLMRSIMENSKKARIPLRDELVALELYLALESMRFKDKFSYRLTVDEELDKDFDEIPPMLIQPYIENALNHGIMNKEGKGHIEVTINKRDAFMVVTVEDDGIGRKKAEEIKAQKRTNHKSMGMEITKNRLEIINRLDHSDLDIEIEDLYDPANHPRGTKVKIYVPLKFQTHEN